MGDLASALARRGQPAPGPGKQRLNPGLALAHGLLAGLGRVIAARLVQVFGIERAMDDAAVAAFRALRLEPAGVARHRFSPRACQSALPSLPSDGRSQSPAAGSLERIELQVEGLFPG